MTPQTSTPEPASVSSPSFSFEAFAAVADRLEAALDHETEALERHRPCDLVEVTGRKRQGLLELSRFLPRLATIGQREGAQGRLNALAVKLERNKMALDVQMNAVRDIADIIARTLREAESDGTYSLAAGRP